MATVVLAGQGPPRRTRPGRPPEAFRVCTNSPYARRVRARRRDRGVRHVPGPRSRPGHGRALTVGAGRSFHTLESGEALNEDVTTISPG
ncbi:hypothetical protein QJS66_19800 [Kocuria rhizophila]|nr:hypothetical protein QJS66_19800 [Kocuria rhizophila]